LLYIRIKSSQTFLIHYLFFQQGNEERRERIFFTHKRSHQYSSVYGINHSQIKKRKEKTFSYLNKCTFAIFELLTNASESGCVLIKARSKTYKSTALSSGSDEL